MSELVGFGSTSVESRLSRTEPVGGAAGLPRDMVDTEPAATSLAAALEKKHTFDCAQPTRGGLCDC
jgi:hypothetical protein